MYSTVSSQAKGGKEVYSPYSECSLLPATLGWGPQVLCGLQWPQPDRPNSRLGPHKFAASHQNKARLYSLHLRFMADLSPRWQRLNPFRRGRKENVFIHIHYPLLYAKSYSRPKVIRRQQNLLLMHTKNALCGYAGIQSTPCVAM
jgi:hypothetical protein